MSRIAVYPGSFDPVTVGHLDIIKRAARIFDHVIVAVSNNSAKGHTFSLKERLGMVRDSIRTIPNTQADSFTGLLVDYVKRKEARVLIRGMRVVSDMDYEFQMAAMNRSLNPKVETVFLMPDERYTYLASSIVKDVARMGADTDNFLPPAARKLLRKKLKPKRR
jgi:pantetheine-phosphate adenylyltransferase